MCWAWSGMWRALVAWCLRQSCKRMEKGGEQQAPCSGLPLSPPPASRRVSRAGGGLRQPRGAPGGSPASGFSSPHHDGQSSGPPSAPGTCLRAHGACACLGKPPGAMEERKRSFRVVSVGYFVIKQHKWSGRPPHDARCRRRPSRTSPHNARGDSAVGGCANGRRASVPGARAAPPPGAQRACRISNAAAWHVCRAASPAVNDCICEPNKQRIRRAACWHGKLSAASCWLSDSAVHRSCWPSTTREACTVQPWTTALQGACSAATDSDTHCDEVERSW